MGASFVWVLVSVVSFHGTLLREHIAVFGKEDACLEARRSIQYYKVGPMYFCQKETLK